MFCLRSGNAVCDFTSEREAWDALCNWARDDGLASLEEFALSRIEDGDITLIAMDHDLVLHVACELSEHPLVSESHR